MRRPLSRRPPRAPARAHPPSRGAVIWPLAAGPGEDLRPGLRLQQRLALRDLIRIEPCRRIHAIDRIDRPHEVLLEAVRNRRVDAHAALEADVHAGPLRAARGDALGWDERLARTARDRLE